MEGRGVGAGGVETASDGAGVGEGDRTRVGLESHGDMAVAAGTDRWYHALLWDRMLDTQRQWAPAVAAFARAVGLDGAFSPFADIDRSMPTRSVNPYFPNRYLIIALSSMALLLLSILPNCKQMGSTGSIRGKVQGHVKARHAWIRGRQMDVLSRVENK